ncbi:hypothetical protein IV203_029896 [Nitzschia inconspicua]|uniref:Uncharacterized protein n=1 Tax=Nitzschia inconspicua TaxID=303405 RepID=A0A9K3Q1N1_9STRA|nr:hypothetical protein IV203_029896 [Nitzschia inconspicua]
MQQQAMAEQKIHNESHVFPPPQVVILPGPHKTGSTSLQTCLVDWTWNELSKQIRQTKRDQAKHPLVLSKWAWSAPDEAILRRNKLNHVHPTKDFASLMGIVDLDPTLGLSLAGRNETGDVITTEKVYEVVKLYETSMEDAWRRGYNIIYESEEMDRLVDPAHSNSSILMDTILNILPWNATGTPRKLIPNEVEVVLFHRTPRVKHLISVWHQERRKKESFRNYLLKRVSRHARYVDALGIAQQFLRRNFRTTIIDVNGVVETFGNRTNTCHVIACDVLKTEDCTKDTRQISYLTSHPDFDISYKPQNQRDDKSGMDLTVMELYAIDKIMIEYDCGFRKSLGGFRSSSLLRYMYNDDLFAVCDKLKNGTNLPERSLTWMVDNIRGIVKRRQA